MPTLQFKGKNIIWNHHLAVPFHTLDEVPELHCQPDKAKGNMIIEGDNLIALKALLPQFTGRVQCIYIDPPYNTGNENGTNKGWIYNDNVSSPLLKDWFSQIVNKDDLTRHDKWCCMMVPRLKLLHELLDPKGVIFISIDDNEVHHLRSIMNDIFGEENFIASIIWNTGRKSTAKLVAINHEYCLIYAKDKSKQSAEEVENGEDEENGKLWREKKMGLDSIYSKFDELKKEFGEDYGKISQGLKEFFNSLSDDNPTKAHDHYCFADKRGIYFPDNTAAPDKPETRSHKPLIHPITKKPTAVPELGWRYTDTTLKKLVDEDRIHFGTDETTVPNKKTYLRDTEFTVPSSVFYRDARGAKKRLKSLFGGKDIFTFPKDEEIIKKFIRYCTKGEDIILDSYAGSGTTMHALMELNKEDGGNRKCIMVQMPENSEAEPDKNICKDITRERVKRAIDKYGYDSGFKYYRLGIPLDAETMLAGQLPTYNQFAKYVYYLCTGENLEAENKIKEKDFYVGEYGKQAIYLVYKQDYETLTRLALNLTLAEKIKEQQPGKKRIVYAPSCFLDEEYLTDNQIEYVGIPYNLFQRNQ